MATTHHVDTLMLSMGSKFRTSIVHDSGDGLTCIQYRCKSEIGIVLSGGLIFYIDIDTTDIRSCILSKQNWWESAKLKAVNELERLGLLDMEVLMRFETIRADAEARLNGTISDIENTTFD